VKAGQILAKSCHGVDSNVGPVVQSGVLVPPKCLSHFFDAFEGAGGR